jgi:hypothetical protein
VYLQQVEDECHSEQRRAMCAIILYIKNVAKAAIAIATMHAFTSTTMTLLPAAVAATSMLSENKMISHTKKVNNHDLLISSIANMSRSGTHLKKPSYLQDEAPPAAAGRGSLERAASPSSCKKRACYSNCRGIKSLRTAFRPVSYCQCQRPAVLQAAWAA